MKVPFELEWMGGAPERQFRKARPGTDDLPWGTLDKGAHDPAAVEQARVAWTEVAINEYRAVASFSEVLRALIDARAPLDLIGMTSDFLADECAHVELASRMAMELGGAAPRLVDFDRLTAPPRRGLTGFQRANELVLRVSSVAEAFSGGTAAVSYQTASHPLAHAVYGSILRDEAHHRRLGPLYFEWALARIDDDELQRLGRVLRASLAGLAPFWKSRAAKSTEEPAWVEADLRSLGWLGPAQFGPVARDVVVREILDPLATIGITITPDERAELLA